MIIIHRKKLGLRITEVYFGDMLESSKFSTDVLMYVFANAPGSGLLSLSTLIIDLKRDQEQLLRDCSKTTRYSIRRADEKDNFKVELSISPKEQLVADFLRFYSVFSRQKNRPMISIPKLNALLSAGALAVSVISDERGAALCYHAHVVDRAVGRSMRLYSATHHRGDIGSSERSLIGRASRFLTWMDFLNLKNLGFFTYDMGGVPSEDSNPELRQIGDFKKTFGGTEQRVYSGFVPVTLLGKLACFLVTKRIDP